MPSVDDLPVNRFAKAIAGCDAGGFGASFSDGQDGGAIFDLGIHAAKAPFLESAAALRRCAGRGIQQVVTLSMNRDVVPSDSVDSRRFGRILPLTSSLSSVEFCRCSLTVVVPR